MNLGFETIGNATLICHDGEPVLATDPWIQGSAYFGSWTLSHEIPTQQFEAIRQARFIWFSHGHQDHLNAGSLDLVRNQIVLIGDHYGGRIKRDLEAEGMQVQVCPDREWMTLSDRIRIMCITDYNQDSVLLVDVGGKLIINLNDAHDRGWDSFVRNIVRQYDETFLLCLTGYGDAYLINYYDEEGEFISPTAARRDPVGPQIAALTRKYGARYFVPFSSMHMYQRSDSVKMNRFATPLDAYGEGFQSGTSELLPAFIRYDFEKDECTQIEPAATPERIIPCEEFGDDWSETLDGGDFEKIRDYFLAFDHLGNYLDFIRFRVGGESHVVEFKKRGFDRGLTFEAPRNSLMQAIDWKVFDDLLICNFVKGTLHGKWPPTQIYPDFEPYVTKYGDNGQAYTSEELRAYFRHYRNRGVVDYLMHRIETRSRDIFRNLLPEGSAPHALAKRGYRLATRS